jgi:hypothetical protein
MVEVDAKRSTQAGLGHRMALAPIMRGTALRLKPPSSIALTRLKLAVLIWMRDAKRTLGLWLSGLGERASAVRNSVFSGARPMWRYIREQLDEIFRHIKIASSKVRAALDNGHDRRVKVHSIFVRTTHWINAVAIIIMIGSGWRIYNNVPIFSWFTFPEWATLGGDPEITYMLASVTPCCGTSRPCGSSS